jgi:CubicO group peptidase (beta-lactamase class C family)/D-alanyl-D-alanine dipeptidase
LFRAVLLLAALALRAAAADTSRLEAFIRHEIADKSLPALSIALVDDQRIVWQQSFGTAKADTVYRVGSVSKLFTDIGIMQRVERGEIDLDAPLTRYLPDFQPANPFGKPITLRQLMSHRAGLVREPPVGSYFDAAEPSLEATVRSLNQTKLIYAPGSRTKYSNAGIAVAGYVLERLSQQPFAAMLRSTVLDPLGLRESGFEPSAPIRAHLSTASLWTYDGRAFDAPTFQLGIAPAGSMYSTAGDLARFLNALFAGGRGVLKPETIQAMWKPQFGSGFGIGFRVGTFDGHRLVGHGGAIYGFATDLAALPDEKLGAVVITTKDSTNAVVNHIAREALRLLLADRAGKPAPSIAVTTPIPPEEARSLGGRYENFDLIERNGDLFLLPRAGGKMQRLRRLQEDLVTDGPLGYGEKIRLGKRVPMPAPPHQSRFDAYLGEYGWDHDELYILERDGRLNALIEWYDYYPLQEISPGLFRFPGHGLYDGETIRFTADTATVGGSVVFRRRPIGPGTDGIYRIQPMRPVAELRRESLALQPPKESGDFRTPDLVELVALDPTIRLDIRYATTNNFLSTPVYPKAKAMMQRPAAEAVARANKKLRSQGFGLLIHDAYRPWYVTKMFWEATPADKRIFVADPSQGSRHNRGCAVDLTMFDLKTGRAVEMTGAYDEMSERSYPDYPGGTSLARYHREILRRAMEDEGFTIFEFEWWHFDYRSWKQYPILNQDF